MSWTTLRKVPKKNEYKKHTAYVIIGHIAHIRKMPSKVQKKYDAWKDHVRLYLDAKLRVEGWNGKPISYKGIDLITQAYFCNKVHCDTLNVQKLTEDILVGRQGSKKKSTFFLKGDKCGSGTYNEPKYDKKNPRLIVILEGVNL